MNFEVIEKLKSELNSCRLMAVSKTRTIDEIMEVYNKGIRLFGENHVQEIIQKFSSGKPADLELHMIGHLQSNKVNKVVPLVDMIESVDSFALLEKINSCAEKNNKIMSVLLELNTSGEETKSGFDSTNELLAALDKAKELRNVKVRGLMTVGPVSCAPEEKDRLTDVAFKSLKALYDSCKNRYGFDTLSMGMSQDYKIGIQNGSTEVRIGTLIFGERFYG